jgi:hypothetical protein
MKLGVKFKNRDIHNNLMKLGVKFKNRDIHNNLMKLGVKFKNRGVHQVKFHKTELWIIKTRYISDC